jgi:hypothetical protein
MEELKQRQLDSNLNDTKNGVEAMNINYDSS